MILRPPESDALRAVAAAAAAEPSARSAHLVGGAVRDRLRSGRWEQGPDLDVVVEGDAVAVARRLPGDVVVHPAFGTATWRAPSGDVDLVTARSEAYAAPGALPDVAPADLDADLRRRDFTVNALALRLWPEPAGVLVDPLGGASDLSAGLLRALHPRSFADDPTRILRAARYATRLGLALHPATRAWMEAADVASVSGERWLAEWRQVLAEPDPAAVLRWLGEEGWSGRLGLLADPPPLRAFDGLEDGWLGALAAAGGERPLGLPEGFQARCEALRAPPPPLEGDDLELEQAVGPMDPLRRAVLAVRRPDLAPALARGAALAAEPPLLRGADLLAAGLPPGPAVGEALRRVRRAQRLEGVCTPDSALALLRAEGRLPRA